MQLFRYYNVGITLRTGSPVYQKVVTTSDFYVSFLVEMMFSASATVIRQYLSILAPVETFKRSKVVLSFASGFG